MTNTSRLPQRILAPLLVALACLVMVQPAPAAPGQGKTAIVLVAFGTTSPEAEAAYANIEKMVKAAFPATEVRLALSSKAVRGTLQSRGQSAPASLAEVLAALPGEGFSRAAVQPLLIIPGREFHDLAAVTRAFTGLPKGLEQVTLGLPLLASTLDLKRAAQALTTNAPKQRTAGQALVFVGHGTSHPAGVYYPALQYYLWQADPLAFAAAIESGPGPSEVIAELARRGAKTAYLIPLLTVAGEHARTDLAGDGPDSFKTRLAAAGIACIPVMSGLGENDTVAAIWIDHLGQALASLNPPAQSKTSGGASGHGGKKP